MHAQDIIDYVENHSKQEGDAYLDSLFRDDNIIKYKSKYEDRKDKITNYVVKDKVCLTEPELLHFPYGKGAVDYLLAGYYDNLKFDKYSATVGVDETVEAIKENFPECDFYKVKDGVSHHKSLAERFNEFGLDISSVEILLKICEYNNKHPASDIADRLLEAAHKNGVTWCDEIVKDRDNPYFYINTLCKHYSKTYWDIEDYFSVSGKNFKDDFKAIEKMYEFTRYRTNDQASAYRLLQPIRDKAREYLFEAIAQGKTSYDYKDLKEFYDLPPERKIWGITGWVDGSDNNDWRSDKTNVFETNAYKRAMRRIEYEIFKHENKELFNKKDFTKLPAEQKDLILEFTDSKDVAKAIIDTYKGNIEYNDLIARHFTREEFEQAVEDYKITQYRRDNERLKAENAQMKEDVAKEWEKIRQENDKILTTKGQLRQERNEVAEETARIRAKSEEIAFIKDIDKVNKNGPDEFDTNRKKELFAKMKEEMLKDPNLREGHLVGMCKIYASKTNTPEQKAEYFEGLHEVRKSGTTNAEKREMARTFGRVLERNPDLAKDEGLKGLAKIDYSAVGYTPTKRGFSKNSKSDLEK